MVRLLVKTLGITIGLFVLPAHAVEVDDLKVLGLSSAKGTAILNIGSQQRFLKVGESSLEGVELLHVDGRGVTVLIDGVSYRLNRPRVQSSHKNRKVIKRIYISANGQYLTPGSINGHVVQFLVDTGANSVAMNSETARALGIDFAAGQSGQSSTAGGLVKSYRVTLDSVKVGDITVRHVRASVLEGVYPSYVLLGMTYLSHVEMNENAGLMTLTKKY